MASASGRPGGPRRWRRRRDPEPGRLIALDLEMTGLDPAVDHIVEIGVVPIVGRRIELGQAWSELVRPGAYRPAGTVAHQIMPVDLDRAAEPARILDRLDEIRGPDPLLVHHAGVDLPFLRRLAERLGRTWTTPPVVDTVDLLTERNRRRRQLGEPELPLQLGQARRALDLPGSAEHRALDDAIATAELWLALTAERPRPERPTG